MDTLLQDRHEESRVPSVGTARRTALRSLLRLSVLLLLRLSVLLLLLLLRLTVLPLLLGLTILTLLLGLSVLLPRRRSRRRSVSGTSGLSEGAGGSTGRRGVVWRCTTGSGTGVGASLGGGLLLLLRVSGRGMARGSRVRRGELLSRLRGERLLLLPAVLLGRGGTDAGHVALSGTLCCCEFGSETHDEDEGSR